MRIRYIAVVVLFAAVALYLPMPGLTRLDLARDGGLMASSLLADGQEVLLTWRNSLFGLDVTEVFRAEHGTLIQERVTFARPGVRTPVVTALDVEDLYQTGGPFEAGGLERPFTRIVYRVGEIGNPVLHLPGRRVSLKQEVGFGGRVVLTAEKARLYHLLTCLAY